MRAVPTIRSSLKETQQNIQKMDALFDKINAVPSSGATLTIAV
ncbi:MAG: hypothetical protein OXE59_12540 [Bacteroidetes bacterium]|nr:hypothetical protein [Bacteroidota bacterium]MCY4234551.1 hypothetical protein [Bacteroidota bacterium]